MKRFSFINLSKQLTKKEREKKMKHSIWLMLLFPLAVQAQAVLPAATPAPTPFVDPNPYQSQMWIRTNDSLIRTLSALPGPVAFAFEQPNALPPIFAMGTNYGIFKNSTQYMIATLDSSGRFYPYGKSVEPHVTGGVYFTQKGTEELYVVDSDGALMKTAITAPAIRIVGGNYFIDQDGVLTTIKSMGAGIWNWAGMISSKKGLKVPVALFGGGNYFVDAEAKVTTISSIDGFFSVPIELPSKILAMGGNYIIGTDLSLFVITNDGSLVFSKKLSSLPKVMTSSLMVFADHTFIYVKGDGTLKETLNVVALNGSPRVLNTLDLDIDQKKVKASDLGVKVFP